MSWRVRWTRLAAMLPALALVAGLVAGGVHQHARGDDAHPCSLCALAHVQATSTGVVAQPAPDLPRERVALAPRATTTVVSIAAFRSRGPPSLLPA